MMRGPLHLDRLPLAQGGVLALALVIFLEGGLWLSGLPPLLVAALVLVAGWVYGGGEPLVEGRRGSWWVWLFVILAGVTFGVRLAIPIEQVQEEFVLASCGDGVVSGDESCDDGNAVDGDSCTSRCEATPKVIRAEAPIIVDPEALAPPQDRPRSGYIGDRGTSIMPALQLVLVGWLGPEREAEERTVRFGDQRVLPSETIHVVNLWTTWSLPAWGELSNLRALFERHPDWSVAVRFVPILVKDGGLSWEEYKLVSLEMPDTPVKLADRSQDEALLSALALEEGTTLYHDALPVTLVLDCNRRVRWIGYGTSDSARLADIESVVERLRDELEDKRPGAWCRQEWPGNGRCESGEDKPEHHSLADCGELKRKRPTCGNGAVERGETCDDGNKVTDDACTNACRLPTCGDAIVQKGEECDDGDRNGDDECAEDCRFIADIPPPKAECPAGRVRAADGRCIPRLRGATERSPAAPAGIGCGDGACGAQETPANCCQDCPCDPPLVCKVIGDVYKCMIRGLR